MPSAREVTQWLADWSQGDKAALDKLLPVLYDELRRLAQHYLRRERPNHTLQPTALVHEAYLRLVDQTNARWDSRTRFLAMAAEVMRHVLVDHARQHQAAKRGGGVPKLSLEEIQGFVRAPAVGLLALDAALQRLTALDPQQSRIIELRFFGGLTAEETAEALGVSVSTVNYEWRLARAWLLRELHTGGEA